MRADSETHIAALKGAELGVAQACLDGHEQQGAVATPDPRARVGRSEDRGGLRLGEELDRGTFVALVRDRQDLLALKGAGRLGVRDEAEECSYRRETGVAGLRRAGPFMLEVLEEGADEHRVEVLHA
jgi:hypothetical protein